MVELFKYIQESLSFVYDKDEAQNIAYLILEDIFEIERIEIFTNQMTPTQHQLKKIEDYISKLNQHQPIQQVLGYAEFLDLKFQVNQYVLIPRPETEELVQLFIDENKMKTGKVIDIGCGSGCIGIGIKKYCPDLEVLAIDISKEALDLAQINANHNNCEIKFSKQDILNFEETALMQMKFDFIISNPPYVLESEKKQMHKNVLDFEPSLALFVQNNNPIVFYKRIIDFSKSHLNQNGRLYFEINENFALEIEKILAENGFSNTQSYKDFRGNDRFISASI